VLAGLLDGFFSPHSEGKRLRSLRAKDYRELEFLSLDLELTSLDAKQGDIVSVGYVPIIEGKIEVGQGRHRLIYEHEGVGDSAVIHGIRDCDTEQGVSLAEALAELDRARHNRVLLFHHAQLDLSFLAKHQAIYQGMPAVDTLLIEHKRRQRKNLSVDNELRLNQCRERYNLPQYLAHNALTDALATAELFLAQIAHLGGDKGVTLKEVLAQSR